MDKEGFQVKKQLDWTGERYISSLKGNIELEHLHRYFFARELIHDKRVLDIACGDGYGAYILSEVAKSVTGVDISEEAIAFAKQQYVKDNLQFKVGLCSTIPLPDRSVDVVVSFETIEHHAQHKEMMMEISRVLCQNGILILSSPDKYEYSDLPQYKNPFHVKELYKQELEELLNSYFTHINILGQRLMFGSNIVDLNANNREYITFSGDMHNLSVNRGMNKPLYFIAIASNGELSNYYNSFYEGNHGDLKEKNEVISNLSVTLHEKEKLLVDTQLLVNEKNTQFNQLTSSINDKVKQLDSLNLLLQEKNRLLEDVTLFLHEKNQQIANLSTLLKDKEDVLNKIRQSLKEVYTSNSWRLCFPLRWLGKYVRKYIFNKKYLSIVKKINHTYKIAGVSGLKNSFLNVVRKKIKKTMQVIPNRLDSISSSPASISLFQHLAEQNQLDSSHYVKFSNNKKIQTEIKLIAFYLPQFHPIPENDEWWGKGFTEWTNVSKALPQFIGHYQPHLPGELGFYDLRLIETQKRQIELAQNYGVYGFCYYHYWFAGKKLLWYPFKTALENPQLDFPFCLCWANENWTRRWDGLDNEIIIKQNHSAEDDIDFIKDIDEALRDKRYIRINGRPLLIIYNAVLLPDPTATAKRWREYCIHSGIGDLYLGAARTFGITNTVPNGFDALIDFPPHYLAVGAPLLNSQIPMINPHYQGNIFDYQYLVNQARLSEKSTIPLFRTVVPSWDNEARKPGRGTTFINSNPALYQTWLEETIAYTLKNNDDKFIFINAWNEWAEGAHLEPDRKYGYAWLQATYNALAQASLNKIKTKLILVSHDAHPHGAQYLALKLAKTLTIDFNFEIDLLLLSGGRLIPEFSKWCQVHDLSGYDQIKIHDVVQRLVAKGHRHAIVNTTVSGLLLEVLVRAGVRSLPLIHELPGVIEAMQLYLHGQSIAKNADMIVFPEVSVANAFHKLFPLKEIQIKIRPQGLIKKNRFKNNREYARNELRKKLGIQKNAAVILGMGYADHRKGVDLFVKIGRKILQSHSHTYFVWVGHWESGMEKLVQAELANEVLRDHFFFCGFDENTDIYYAGADVFALTSREDPFPSVVLQSLEVAVPVIGFMEAGGFTTLLQQGCGLLVPKEDVLAFANATIELLDHEDKRKQLGSEGSTQIENLFSFHHYTFDLLNWLHIPIKRLSVIVPNYNYARFLKKRLDSILNQRYPIFEIIVLDDASTDDSLTIIQDYFSATDKSIEHKIIVNNKNSGSVFAQWKKGIEMAKGDFIWICEADDVADFDFVYEIIQAFDNNEVVMSYSQSQQINDQGKLLANHYHDYTNDIDLEKWHKNYFNDGKNELAYALSIKNTIPNVSGVIFRKDNLRDAINKQQTLLSRLKIAGDWLIYSAILQTGKIAYHAASLNSHRRHQKSVTHASSLGVEHVAEVIFMQKYVAQLIELTPLCYEKATHYIHLLCKHFGVEESHAQARAKVLIDSRT